MLSNIFVRPLHATTTTSCTTQPPPPFVIYTGALKIFFLIRYYYCGHYIPPDPRTSIKILLSSPRAYFYRWPRVAETVLPPEPETGLMTQLKTHNSQQTSGRKFTAVRAREFYFCRSCTWTDLSKIVDRDRRRSRNRPVVKTFKMCVVHSTSRPV